MAKFDGSVRTQIVSAIPADSQTADNSGSVIDTQGFEFALVIVSLGAAADAVHFDVVTDSDVGMAGATAVSGASIELTATDDDSAHFGVLRLDGAERYIRIDADHQATGTCEYGVVVLLTNAQYGDVGTTGDPAFVV